MRTLAICSIALILMSCNPQRWCAKHAPPLQGEDSITYDTVYEHYRDTVILQKRDSSSLVALIECRENEARLAGIIEMESGDRIAPPSVTLHDNILSVNCNADSMAIYLKLKERFEKVIVKTKSREVKIINQPTGFQNFKSWAFWIYTAILICLIVYFVLRKNWVSVLNFLKNLISIKDKMYF